MSSMKGHKTPKDFLDHQFTHQSEAFTYRVLDSAVVSMKRYYAAVEKVEKAAWSKFCRLCHLSLQLQPPRQGGNDLRLEGHERDLGRVRDRLPRTHSRPADPDRLREGDPMASGVPTAALQSSTEGRADDRPEDPDAIQRQDHAVPIPGGRTAVTRAKEAVLRRQRGDLLQASKPAGPRLYD
jgi:hypothetical protein